MKKLIIILLLLFALPACADDWTRKDTEYQAVFAVVTAVDWLQTKEIARNPKFTETNFILGSNPDQDTVDAYFAGCILAHTAIAYYLPKKYRRIWQCVWIGIEGGVTLLNFSAGVRINF